MRNRTFICIYLAVALALAAPAVSAKDFEPADYQTDEAIAKAAKKLLVQSGLKRIRKGETKTVAITQFSVEYITSKKQLSGAGKSIKSGNFGLGHVLAKSVEVAGVGEKQFDLEEELKKDLPNQLYAHLAEVLTAEGFTVLSLEQVSASEAYTRFKTKDKTEGEKKKKRTNKKWTGGSSTIKGTERYSADGLVKLKAGVVSGIKNARAEAKLLHDLNADISLRVNVRLGVYNHGRPSFEPETVFQVLSGYTEAKMPGGKLVYNPQMQGQVSVKKQLVYGLKVVDDADFQLGKGKVYNVDSERFTTAMDQMFPVFVKMVSSTIE